MAVSGPAMPIAWLKLRQKEPGPHTQCSMAILPAGWVTGLRLFRAESTDIAGLPFLWASAAGIPADSKAHWNGSQEAPRKFL